MSEYEFVDSMSKIINKDYIETKKFIQSILECITEELIKGGKVKLVDFGTFEVVQRAARKGYQPYYKTEIVIPACNEPVFKAGMGRKKLINDTDYSLLS